MSGKNSFKSEDTKTCHMSALGMRIFWQIFFGQLSHRILILKTEVTLEIDTASWALASASVLIFLATVTDCHRLAALNETHLLQVCGSETGQD